MRNSLFNDTNEWHLIIYIVQKFADSEEAVLRAAFGMTKKILKMKSSWTLEKEKAIKEDGVRSF